MNNIDKPEIFLNLYILIVFLIGFILGGLVEKL